MNISITIDKTTQEIPKENFSTFKDLYEILNSELTKEKRVISKIIINNEVMSEGKQFDFFDTSIQKIYSVEIETVLKEDMVREHIFVLREQIEKIVDNCNKSILFFREGNEIESNRYFSAVIEGLRWFNYAIDLIVSFNKIDIYIEKSGNKTLKEIMDSFSSIINNIAEYQENQDWIMIADVLEYELVPALKEWNGIIEIFNKK